MFCLIFGAWCLVFGVCFARVDILLLQTSFEANKSHSFRAGLQYSPKASNVEGRGEKYSHGPLLSEHQEGAPGGRFGDGGECERPQGYLREKGTPLH